MNTKLRIATRREAAELRAAGLGPADARARGLILPMAGGEPTERELLERRNALIVAMRSILDGAAARPEGQRDLTAEEAQEFERREADVTTLDESLRRTRSLGRLSSEQRELVTAARAAGGGVDDDETRSQWLDSDDDPEARADDDAARQRRSRGLPGQLDGENGDGRRQAARTLTEWRQRTFGLGLAADDEYREAFYAYLSRRSRENLSPAERRALAKGGSAAALVPIEFERSLMESVRDAHVIRNLANVITTSTGDKLVIPRVTANGAATWLGEAQAFVEADDTFDSIEFEAYKAGTIIRVSEELLEDSMFDLEAYIRAEFVLRIGELQNAAYVAGDGIGKPTGVVQEAAIGKVGAGGQVATVTADDLIDLVYSVRRPFRVNGQFMLNDLTIAALRKLKDADGNYLWVPGLREGEADVLLGYRVNDEPSMPVMAASAKSVLFGDFRHYWIRDVGGVRFQRLDEKYADQGQVGFRAYQRTEGRLTRVEAVKAYQNAAA